jgi:dipeptidase D
MVSYNTVADKEVPFERNPQHAGFKNFLKGEAARLGLDFADYGQVLVIGLGPVDAQERVGMVAHGDVQPVDPSKWKKSPFELDRSSEPGKLLARGAEDDKGPIATALYAMKSLKDLQLPLSKRIELYVYMAEESDWDALEQFVKTHTLPQVNITLDAEYPAVTAEKGYGTLAIAFPAAAAPAPQDQPSRRTRRRPSPTRPLRSKRTSGSALRSRPACTTGSNGRTRSWWSRPRASRRIPPSPRTD